MDNLAPILLFTYNRSSSLKQTINALKTNVLATNSDLYIFSDGPKSTDDMVQIDSVRSIIRNVSGFRNIFINESISNKGLANSIIEGVSSVIEKYGKVIVLEDDLVTSPNFLHFMNQALYYYEDSNRVFSISGYTPPTITFDNKFEDVFFFPRNSSHGWATWKDRWSKVDWSLVDYDNFISNKSLINKFNIGGSDLTGMLRRQKDGKINSWSIRFCYTQFKLNALTVYPFISKIQNVGFGVGATHTNNYNRFYTTLDKGNNLEFLFTDDIVIDPKAFSQFQFFYSLRARGFGKLLTLLYKLGLVNNR